MKTISITDLHEEIAKILIARLRKNHEGAYLTYGELCKLLDNKIDPRNVASYLGDLSVWSFEIGAPMISVLVYNKNINCPGKGFFRLYSDLYGRKVKKDEEDKVFMSEGYKVVGYKEWDRLEEYLGL